jgi:hypothetical protein
MSGRTPAGAVIHLARGRLYTNHMFYLQQPSGRNTAKSFVLFLQKSLYVFVSNDMNVNSLSDHDHIPEIWCP